MVNIEIFLMKGCFTVTKTGRNFLEEVLVVETGFLMGIDPNEFLEKYADFDIYIPSFCIHELEKLSNRHAIADAILLMYRQANQISSINLHQKETLFKNPTFPISNRSRGVVAVCLELIREGYTVKLLTNSLEIEKLASLQDCEIEVIYQSNNFID